MYLYTIVRLPAIKADREDDALRIFNRAIELRFPGQKGLSEKVTNLGLATGNQLKLNSADIRNLEMAVLVRDIGLCAVPWKMVNVRKESEWTEAEFATFDQRLLAGAAMLEKVQTLKHLAPIVRAVYEISPSAPVPLTKKIPTTSMILGVAERYLQTERLHGQESAKEIIKNESGKRYDPKVVAAFLEVLP